MSEDSSKTLITPAEQMRLGMNSLSPQAGFNKVLKPSFFVFEKGQVRRVEIKDDQPIYTIGRGAEADIRIGDGSVAPIQVACVKFGKRWFFMDCGASDLTLMDGITRRQVDFRSESRMILRVGTAWVIFCGLDCDTYTDTDSCALKRSLLEVQGNDLPDLACVRLSCNGKEQGSSAAPILVGTHESCDFHLPGNTLSPFHFIIYWNQKGLFLEDLTLGTPGIQVNGRRLIGSHLFTENAKIEAGGQKFTVEILGSILEQSEALSSRYSRQPHLTLTNTSGLMPSIVLMPSREPLSVGRQNDTRICIPDASVSRVHAYLTVKEKQILIQDNQSSNKTYVNLKQIDRGILRAGDLVEFGSVPFLLHYEVRR
ncbi:MAG: hypothetical protein RL095_2494 [Verrucomicrobiota bacterium]|jgi:pSer/pThr/pTyr-binding forkhead associated (FHA) protein